MPQPQRTPQMRKLGVAVVGLGKFAQYEILPALTRTQHCRLAGPVSGHPEKAALMASRDGIATRNICTYANYDWLANNPEGPAGPEFSPGNQTARASLTKSPPVYD